MMTQAKYACGALAAAILWAAPNPSTAFDANDWGEHWRTPTYELRYNFYLDVSSILKTKGGELLCPDSHIVALPTVEDIIPLVQTVWDYNKSRGWENIADNQDIALFNEHETIPHGKYYVLFRDQMEGEKRLSVFDLSDSPELMKQLDNTVKAYCSGEKKPTQVEVLPPEERAEPPGILLKQE